MSTSGAFTTFEIQDLIEEAYERAGGQLTSGYDLKTALRSLNFIFAEWANKGLNLWTVDKQTLNLVGGTATYTLPVDTVDVIEQVITQTGVTPAIDLTIERMSVSTYAQLPNKTMPARPLQVYYERKVDAPTATFWPVPDQAYTVTYWRLRRMQDAGNVVNTPDIPFRLIPALVSGLALHLALKSDKGQARLAALKQSYDEALQLALDEDRDRASFRFIPDMD